MTEKPVNARSTFFLKAPGAVLGCLLLSLCMAQAHGAGIFPVKVVVASESWDQLMYEDGNHAPEGVIAEFVNRMNEVQDKFHFDLSIFPRLRLNKAFMDKEADVYPLRNTAWTAPELGLLATKTILSSGDVYFARKNNRYGGSKVFDNPKNKTLAGVRG